MAVCERAGWRCRCEGVGNFWKCFVYILSYAIDQLCIACIGLRCLIVGVPSLCVRVCDTSISSSCSHLLIMLVYSTIVTYTDVGWTCSSICDV